MTSLYQSVVPALFAGFFFLAGCGKESEVSQNYQPTPYQTAEATPTPEPQIDPAEEARNLKLEESLVKFSHADVQDISDLLSTNPDKAREFLVKKWKNYYLGKGSADIEKAIKNSSRDVAAVKYIFNEEGIPVEYAFLAIPESNWSLNARSGASAVGPYQFICSTANQNKLVCNKSLDERINPFLSPRGAAKLLKSLNRSFGGDWDLTLAAYNSGMPWQYLKTINEGESPNYGSYLNFLGRKLDSITEEVRNSSKFVTQKVKKGETLPGFIKRVTGQNPTKKQISQVANRNKIVQGRLRFGQKLVVDMSQFDSNFEEKLWDRRTRFIEENLNYPSKFIAVIDVLNSENNYKPYFETKMQKGVSFYTLKTGKNLAEVSAEKNVGIKTLLELNPHIKGQAKKIKKKTIQIARETVQLPKGATIVLPARN